MIIIVRTENGQPVEARHACCQPAADKFLAQPGQGDWKQHEAGEVE